MAGIDKTYGTKEQSRQLYDWLKRHRPKFLRYHYGVNNYDHLPDNMERSILNTPVSVDKWLVRHCPLEFVLQRLGEVYSGDHVVSKWATKRLL